MEGQQIEGTTLNSNFVYHTDNMWESKETDKLDAALATFFGEVEAVKRASEVKVSTKSGSQYSYKFASLDEALEVIRPALAKSKLFIQQPIAGRQIITMIRHESGQFRASSMQIIAWEGIGTTQIQNFGGAITFLRRYSLFTFLGIAGDDDNDARHSDHKMPPQQQKAKPAQPPAQLTEQQQTIIDEWTSQVEQCKTPADFEKLSGGLKSIKDPAVLTPIRSSTGAQMAKHNVVWSKELGYHETDPEN